MQVKKTQVSPTKIKLVFNLSETDLAPIKQAAVQKLGQNVKLPGFRPGKAPAKIVEKNIDQNVLQSEVMEEAINYFYAATVRKDGLRPVDQPQVSIKKFVPFTTLEFEVEVLAVGTITLPNYKKMKKALPKVTVTAKDVNDVIETLRDRVAKREAVDRAAKNDDQVTINFKGTDAKGEAIAGAEGNDYPLILGSNQFIPGFETNLLGLKTGDNKEFSLKFPKDYNVKALANKKVTFAVTINKVEALSKPKVDDSLAKEVGPFKNLAELKADVKKQLIAEKQQNVMRDYQNELLETIAAKSTVDVPENLVESQLDAAEKEERQNLMYRGQTWEEHLKEEGVTEAEHRKRNRAQAANRVKAGLVLSEISEKEGLDVTPEELEVRIQLLRGQYKDPAMLAELDKPENRRDIAMRMLSEKTIEKLTEYATKS